MAQERRLLARVLAVVAGPGSLDDKLTAIAPVLISALGDVCLVDRRYADGTVERLTVRHVDPSREPLSQEVRLRFPPLARHPARLVFATGEAELEAVVSQETLRQMAHDDAHFEILRSAGPRSSMRLPVKLRGSTVAVITLSVTGHRRTQQPRIFSARDFELAREIIRQLEARLAEDG